MTVTLTDDEGNVGYGETDFIVEAARKRALDEAGVRKQLDRLGTTEYFLNSLLFEHDENVMVPMSEMNEARRMACEALDAARLNAFAPARTAVHSFSEQLVPQAHKAKQHESVLVVHCDSVEKVNAALQAGAERILFGGDCFNHQLPSEADYAKAAKLVRKAGRQMAFATPRIIKEAQLAIISISSLLCGRSCSRILFTSTTTVCGPWRRSMAALNLVADMSLNIFNSQTLQFWQEQGAAGAVLSPELTMAQVEHLVSVSPAAFGVHDSGTFGNDGFRILRRWQLPGCVG